MDLTTLMDALPVILKGYAGVFGVTIAIILVVKILSAATSKKQK